MIEPRLDLEFVRRQFPAFGEPSLRDRAFVENAGGSYACRHTIWRLSRYYRERKVQPHHNFRASLTGGEEIEDARSRLAQMLAVPAADLSFGPSTTQNTYVLAHAFGEWLPEGSAIIVTNQDHEANSGTWRRLAGRGIDVREWRMDPETGQLAIEDLADLLDEKVKLVCFTHCSNILGEINDAAGIAALAHEAGAVVCVDGVSYVPHGMPNIAEIGADIYLFSTYKTFGPHQGVMYVSSALSEHLPNQGHYFNCAQPSLRYTPAGADHAQIAACNGVADYIDVIYEHHFQAGRDAKGRAGAVKKLIRTHEEELMAPLLDYLRCRNDIRLLGPQIADGRAPTISLVTHGDPLDVVARLDSLGIMAGAGDFYARRCLRGIGVDPERGVLRLSFVHYNTSQEVDRLILALDQVL